MPDKCNSASNERLASLKKVLSEELDNLSEKEAVEFILSNYTSERNPKEKADKLISASSFESLFDLPVDMLIKYGLSKNTAVFFKIIPQLNEILIKGKYSQNDNLIITEEAVIEKLTASFVGALTEKVILILTDDNNKELFIGTVSKGAVSASEIYTRKIMALASKYKASKAIISHNHPSGIAIPSNSDVRATFKLINSLNAIDVKLTDHIIVAGANFFSMAKSREYMCLFTDDE